MNHTPHEKDDAPVCFRGREWIAILADELAYADLLAEAFPGVRFVESGNSVSIDKPPPDIQPRASLADCVDTMVHIVFDPSWTLRWRPNKATGWWTYDPDPLPNGTMNRMTIWQPQGAPRPLPYNMDGRSTWGRYNGRVYFRIRSGNKEHESFARKALRLFGKVASNKNLMMAYTETLEIFNLDARHAPLIGHHARRWCLEKPDRLLGATRGLDGWGYRPKPEGFVPPPVLAPPPHKNAAILRARAESEAARREPPSIVHERQWIATLADELAYADLLAATFPGVRFVEKPLRTSARWPMPDTRPQASLADCLAEEVHIVFDPSWELRWRTVWIREDYSVWTHGAIPLPNGTILRETLQLSSGPKDYEPIDMDKEPRLHAGQVRIRVEPGNKEHEAIARKALGLIDKIAKQPNLVRVARKTLEVIDDKIRSVPWIGHHAYRWCLEKPDRLLGNTGTFLYGWGYRPKPE